MARFEFSQGNRRFHAEDFRRKTKANLLGRSIVRISWTDFFSAGEPVGAGSPKTPLNI
jgi:hypothetical protein